MNDDYHVTEVGGGEEYFTKDYDQVHCEHGRYIGYPGGPDFLCFECEMGYNFLYKRTVWNVNYLDKPLKKHYYFVEAQKHIESMYDIVRNRPFVKWWNVLKNIQTLVWKIQTKRNMERDFSISSREERYWGTEPLLISELANLERHPDWWNFEEHFWGEE